MYPTVAGLMYLHLSFSILLWSSLAVLPSLQYCFGDSCGGDVGKPSGVPPPPLPLRLSIGGHGRSDSEVDPPAPPEPNLGGHGRVSGDETPCKDKMKPEDCEHWQSLGYCDDYSRVRDIMRDQCSKTCGFCRDVVPVEFPEDPCERVVCDYIPCREDEVWSNDEFSCCGGCAKFPTQGCNPVYKPVHLDQMYVDGALCRTVDPIVTSACFGVCATSTIHIEGAKYKDCSCCDAKEFRRAKVKVECWPGAPNAYETTHEYDVIDSCICSSSTCQDDFLFPPPEGGVMENYWDVNKHVDNFNSEAEEEDPEIDFGFPF